MRRFVVPALLMVFTAALDSALLPELFVGAWRPRLTLILASLWAHGGDIDGAVTAFIGGFALEAVSGLPFGVNLFGLMLGNVVALGVDQAPIPSTVLRATNWVATTTLVYQLTLLGAQIVRGMDVNLDFAVTSVILPTMLFHPLLAIPLSFVVRPAQAALRRGGIRGRR